MGIGWEKTKMLILIIWGQGQGSWSWLTCKVILLTGAILFYLPCILGNLSANLFSYCKQHSKDSDYSEVVPHIFPGISSGSVTACIITWSKFMNSCYKSKLANSKNFRTNWFTYTRTHIHMVTEEMFCILNLIKYLLW